jgi:hypothetical protein
MKKYSPLIARYVKAGETFATDVKVLDAATKQLLKSASSRGQGASSILMTQIDELSRSISRGIGLPALKIEKPQPKIADLTTTSLEAYNYFLRGQDALDRFLFNDARRSLEKAVGETTTLPERRSGRSLQWPWNGILRTRPFSRLLGASRAAGSI